MSRSSICPRAQGPYSTLIVVRSIIIFVSLGAPVNIASASFPPFPQFPPRSTFPADSHTHSHPPSNFGPATVLLARVFKDDNLHEFAHELLPNTERDTRAIFGTTGKSVIYDHLTEMAVIAIQNQSMCAQRTRTLTKCQIIGMRIIREGGFNVRNGGGELSGKFIWLLFPGKSLPYRHTTNLFGILYGPTSSFVHTVTVLVKNLVTRIQQHLS